MTGREFMNAVGGGKTDVLDVFLGVLRETGADYCVIGGLAVNAYAEPVVSLDLDIVVAARDAGKVRAAAKDAGFQSEQFEHSVNLTVPGSNLRIQLQTDPRYQEFVRRATPKDILGYQMNVAAIEDVLQGKIWACLDDQRRRSKRQKDLADILRLVEAEPALDTRIPPALRAKLT